MTRAAEYGEVFRVWPARANKTPLMRGFGAENPKASWPVDRFRADLPVALLCGPLQPGQADDVHILGLDLDKEMNREKLEAALGCKLPETLTSKGWRHAYYFIPKDHPLHQRNKAIVCEGGALDIRPCAGGYLIEKGDWDRGFDPLLIAELPQEALAKLAQFIGEKRQRDGAPPETGIIQISDRDTEIAKEIAGVWEHHKTGDRALGALGGWLARRGVSRDRAEAIAGLIVELTDSQHPDPLERVAQAYDGACPLGRPALQHALSEGMDEGAVLLTLESVEEILKASVPGFVSVEEKPTTEEVKTKKAMLNLVSPAELAAPLGEIPWLVEGLDLAPGRPMVVAGAAGSGKTYALQDLALSVAGAKAPVWNQFPVSRVGSVLHIDVDQGKYATALRYQLLARGRGVSLTDLQLECSFFDFAMSNKQGISLEAAKALRDVCKGRALCIIDSLRGIAPGLDEQDSSFGDVLQALTQISSITQCTFIVVAHSGHDQNRARGTSAIQDRAGAIFQLTKEEEAEGEGHVTWQQKKRSEFGQSPFISFCTKMDRTPDGLDNRTVIRVVEVPVAAKSQKPMPISPVLEAALARQKIIDFVKDSGGATARVMRGKVNVDTSKIGPICRRLCEEGTFDFDGRKYLIKRA